MEKLLSRQISTYVDKYNCSLVNQSQPNPNNREKTSYKRWGNTPTTPPHTHTHPPTLTPHKHTHIQIYPLCVHVNIYSLTIRFFILSFKLEINKHCHYKHSHVTGSKILLVKGDQYQGMLSTTGTYCSSTSILKRYFSIQLDWYVCILDVDLSYRYNYLLNRSGELTSLHSVDRHPGQPHIVATGSGDGVLGIWDLRQEKSPVSLLEAHNGPGEWSSPIPVISNTQMSHI